MSSKATIDHEFGTVRIRLPWRDKLWRLNITQLVEGNPATGIKAGKVDHVWLAWSSATFSTLPLPNDPARMREVADMINQAADYVEQNGWTSD